VNPVEALWLRALRAADARGLLPTSKSLTPKEVAAEAARRGEDRLSKLVKSWYYPRSYGRTDGAMSDDEVSRVVAALEAEAALLKKAEEKPAPRPTVAAPQPQQRQTTRCDLCGAVIPGSRA
jgi:hypothetical protein